MKDFSQRLVNLSHEQRADLERRLMNTRMSDPALTIRRRAPLHDIPLSFAQERLWFLHQLKPQSPRYNISKAVRIDGELDHDALRKSFDAIVARHDVLRMKFIDANGSPLQVIGETKEAAFELTDLGNVPCANRERDAQSVMNAAALRPFDLSCDRPLRVILLRFTPVQHRLLIVMHHIASDSWSMRNLLKELSANYDAYHAGRSSPFDTLNIQYADFASWQRQQLHGQRLDSLIAFWKKQLNGVQTYLDLPTDRLRLTDEILDGARQYARLPASLTAALESVSRAEGATLFMTLLAAFQTLLFRYTVQKDIVVGIPVAGRSRVEVEPLIGCFVNTLVICTNFSGNPSFRELLGDVRETTLEAFSHQELPFEKLVQELEPSRNFRQSPLFRVMFALQHRPEQPLVMSGLTVIPVELPAKTAMFDLGLWITLQGKTLTVGIEYKTGLFDEELIARMLSHFQTLLEAIAADPSCAVSRLPMLTQQEQHQVLIGWNQTTVDCSSFFS